MKKTSCLGLCLVGVLAFSTAGCDYLDMGGMDTGPAESEQNTYIFPQQQTGIWVTGLGEATATPDIAILRLGVEAREDTVAESQAEATEAMSQVMESLKENGVAEQDIQTQHFSIYPITQWNERRNEEEVIGYRVTNTIVAKIREVDNAGDVIDAVGEAAGDLIRIQNISFTVDNPTKYYEEARANAMQNAKDKATQLAELSGVQLDEPTYICEGAIYRPESANEYYRGGEYPVAAPETPISPGELKITVSVQVAYAID